MLNDDDITAGDEDSNESQSHQEDEAEASNDAQSGDSNKDWQKSAKILAEKINSQAKTIDELEKQVQSENKPEEEKDEIDIKIERQVWKSENKKRIDAVASEYDKYISEGLSPAHALRLAEADNNIQFSNESADRQRKISSTDAGVDRSDDDLQESETDRHFRQRFQVKPETVKKHQKALKQFM